MAPALQSKGNQLRTERARMRSSALPRSGAGLQLLHKVQSSADKDQPPDGASRSTSSATHTSRKACPSLIEVQGSLARHPSLACGMSSRKSHHMQGSQSVHTVDALTDTAVLAAGKVRRGSAPTEHCSCSPAPPLPCSDGPHYHSGAHASARHASQPLSPCCSVLSSGVHFVRL